MVYDLQTRLADQEATHEELQGAMWSEKERLLAIIATAKEEHSQLSSELTDLKEVGLARTPLSAMCSLCMLENIKECVLGTWGDKTTPYSCGLCS